MANHFPKWTNRLPGILVTGILATAALLVGGSWYYLTPAYSRVGYAPVQPAVFSHRLHVKEIGLDCRYCHSFVEFAAHSNIPTTQSCMACHLQIRPGSPKLEPVRESWMSGRPVSWARVHQVPDYVYFHHAVHVARGIGCAACHGAVDEMDTMTQVKPLSMAWCLECHRAPAAHLRAPGQGFLMTQKLHEPEGAGKSRETEWRIRPPVTCGGCHR